MTHKGPKRDKGGLAMQVTRVARDNEFIRENDDGQVIHRADDLYIYTFDDLCMIIDTERIDAPERLKSLASPYHRVSSPQRSERGSPYGRSSACLPVTASGY